MQSLYEAFVLVVLVSQVGRAEETAEYRSYLDRNAERSLEGHFYGDKQKPLQAVVTIIEAEDRPGRFGEDRRVRYGCRISQEGQTASFQHTEFGSKGSGAPFLAANDWKHLQKLIAKLPDDGGDLPPINRRLIVQVRDGEVWKNRLYDRANAPGEVLEVLRLTGYGLCSWVNKQSPAEEIQVHDGRREGFLCLAPDGKSLISGRGDELKFVAVEDHKTQKTLRLPLGVTLPSVCILSPDGKQAAIAGTGEVMILGTSKWEPQRLIEEPYVAGRQAILTAPHFAPRGPYLLLHSSLPQLVVVNCESVASGRHRAEFQGSPDITGVVLLPGEKTLVAGSTDGKLRTWDAAAAFKQIDELEESLPSE